MAEEIIGGYRLLKQMMTGQTSQVWEVVEISSHRHFAIKLLLPENASNPVHRGLLFHEATVGLAMAHQNIIRITAVNKDQKNPYFVMEFFPGGSLRFRLSTRQHLFIHQNAMKIFKQTATALAFMNTQKWVHRDVKPDNLLVSSAGDLRVIDFALAQRIEKPSLFDKIFRRKNKPQGTRSYMSPEQIRGEPLDGRADIYSFGATCYELITGRPPFRAATSNDLLVKHIVELPVSPCVHNHNVSPEFGDLVLHMLSKKRENRPRDFHEVLMKMQTLKVFKEEPVKPETA